MPDISKISRYKNRLMELFCSSQPVVDLMLNEEQDPNQFIHYPVPNTEIPYKNLYPFSHIPSADSSPSVFITLQGIIPETDSKTFSRLQLLISIYVKPERMECSVGTRADLLAEEIHHLLDRSKDFGLGALKLHSLEAAEAVPQYSGILLTYESQEWSK